MAHFKVLIVSIFVSCLITDVVCKIVLPHKLRYLENMLNSEVVAKAAKIRQRLEANPNLQEGESKSWPVLLAKYGQEEKKPVNNNNNFNNNFNNMYGRRMPNF